MRFVIISFLFMGWAFYELSGGAEFEPRGVRPEKAAQAPAPEQPRHVAAAVRAAQPVEVSDLVAKPVIAPRQARVIAPEITPEPEPQLPDTGEIQAGIAETLDALKREQASAGLNQGSAFFPGTTISAGSLTLAALEQGAAGLQSATPPAAAEPQSEPADILQLAEPEPDIREITGTRVNLRDGPGTIYTVVGRLNIGHQVEILSDSGTGWLRLRTLPERRIGWVASSLISKKAE